MKPVWLHRVRVRSLHTRPGVKAGFGVVEAQVPAELQRSVKPEVGQLLESVQPRQ